MIEVKEWVLQYLREHPCVDCGETDVVVLEFDHIQGAKLSSIGAAMSARWTLPKIKREVAKCEVRCANCHRRKTAQEHGGWFKILAHVAQ